MKLNNATAVLTGAGSGIGRALAQSLAQRGCHLALCDINPASLAETATLLQPLQQQHKLRISQHKLDVADRAAVAALAPEVLGHHPQINLLVNNAGVAAGGSFEQVSETDFDWLFEINFHGVVRMTRSFLPLLRASCSSPGAEARIVNISSVYGLISPPGQSAYAASKFAVRGFSNALRHELAGGPVGMTVVHPGGVATAIARSARKPAGVGADEVAARLADAEKFLRMPPARAGEIIATGIEQNRARVLVGGDAKFIALLERLMPVGYWNVIARLRGDPRGTPQGAKLAGAAEPKPR